MNILDQANILLTIFTIISSVSINEFSTKLQQRVDSLLGAEEFQV